MKRFRLPLTIAAAVLIVAGALAGLGVPVAAEPEPNELAAAGRVVFEKTAGGIGCAACHGRFGMGDLTTAPNIRGANETRLRNALGGVGAMRFLALTPEQVKAVQAFLAYLNTMKPRKIAVNESGFEPDQVTIAASERVQFILHNNREEACDFESADAGIRTTSVAPDTVGDVVWTSPARKATFTARCAQRPEASVTIVVDGVATADAKK